MSDNLNKKRSRDELSDNEDNFSVSSDKVVGFKQQAREHFIDIPSEVSNPRTHGEVSPLDGISGFDHTRLSPQALRQHDLREPSLGFQPYLPRQTSSTDTDTLTTLTNSNSSNNPTPVKEKKRVRFTSNPTYDDEDAIVDNDNEVDDMVNLFNIKLETPPNSPVSDDANVGGSKRRRKSSRVTRRKRKRANKSKTRKAKNKKTRKPRARKTKRYSQKRTKSKNKK